jgi:EpsI family protein
MSERLATAALIVALIASGAVAWWFQLRPDLDYDGSSLERLPLELGDWRGESIPLESAVESMLRADLNLQRAYHGTGSEVVWLYIGYYSTASGGRPEHTPDVCYPSAGWQIASEAVWSDDEARANEYVVERDGFLRLVHFWYQSSRSSGLLGTWNVSVDQLESRVSTGRADGALVRLSTPVEEDDIEAARRRLVDFQRLLAPELAARWPSERPRG